MKKYTKLITLILSLTLIFSLFSGFTYAPLANDGIAAIEQPRSQTIKQGQTLSLGFFIYQEGEKDVKFNWYQCDDVNKTNPILVQTKITSTTDGGLTQGNDACLFDKKMDVVGTFYFYCTATVMSDNSILTSQVATIPVIEKEEVAPTYDIPVKVWYGGKLQLDTKCFDGQILTLADPEVNVTDKFLGWRINYTTDVVSSPITITKSMIGERGHVLILGHYVPDVTQKFTVTYKIWDKTFLFFEGWKESFIKEVETGSIVPSVADKFGLAFDYMSTDSLGKSNVTATTKVTSDMTVYVHLKNIPDTYKIEYKTMEYRMYAGSIIGDYGHWLFKTENIKPGSAINLNIAVPDVKSNDNENELYVFEYWSFDEDGKNKVSNDFVPTENTVIYAQYTGLESEKGFFEKLDNNILKPMNSWWGIGNVWDYVISVIVLLIAVTVALGFALKIVKFVFRKLFNLFG